jgi:hypothetical protein
MTTKDERAISLVRERIGGSGKRAFVAGGPLVHGALGVCPLFLAGMSKVEYITYEETLNAGTVKVSELGEAGSVPELILTNTGEAVVLVMDGEQLVGAKQNRVLNTTVLVAAHSEIVIPVSCVEQGRWHYERTRDMAASPSPLYAGSRASKSVRMARNMEHGRRFDAGQRELWEEVSRNISRDGVSAPTGAMNDHYRQQAAPLEEYRRNLSLDRFEPIDGRTMTGAIFTLGGKVLGLDAFDRAETLAKQWDKLVNSYAIEFLHAEGPGAVDEPAAAGFLDRASKARMYTIDPPGLGIDVRISSDTVVGSALVVDGETVHLYAFNVEPGPASDDGRRMTTRMSRYRDRVLGNPAGPGGEL